MDETKRVDDEKRQQQQQLRRGWLRNRLLGIVQLDEEDDGGGDSAANVELSAGKVDLVTFGFKREEKELNRRVRVVLRWRQD